MQEGLYGDVGKMNEIAILMAAGLGNRMRPLTNSLPKPLVSVRGIPLIETVLSALQKRGVKDVYVVTGYKGEAFLSFLPKHPNVHLVQNRDYATKNNINSIAVVAEVMASSDCFVCEADLFVADENLLCRPLDRSGYFGKFVQGDSSDWVFETPRRDVDGVPLISHIGIGGTNCFNMVGISYFKQPDAARIATAVRAAIAKPENDQLFWDEIVDRLVQNGLELIVHEVKPEAVVECDTVEDLKKLEATLCK